MSKRRRKSTPVQSDGQNRLAPLAGLWPESETDARMAAHADVALSVEALPVAKSRMSVSRIGKSAEAEPLPSIHAAEAPEPGLAPMLYEAVQSAADDVATSLAAEVPAAPMADPVLELLATAASPADPSPVPGPSLAEDRATSVIEVQPRLGARLRAAREVRGISREDMARRLRVSPTVVSDLESENWARLGASVYVRGHLKNYARMLDIPQVAVAHAVNRMGEVGPLLPSLPAAGGSWSGRNRHAFTYLVYALLTLMLAVPTYTMLNNRGINSPEPLVANVPVEFAARDSAADATAGEASSTLPGQVPAAVDAFAPVDPPMVPGTVPGVEPIGPMMASMTPLAEAPPASALAEGQHQLAIVFSDRSWLELLDADGRRLEYGILGAGESRQYRVSGPVSLSVGNVSAVTLSVDGERVDLGAYARQNVARLKLFEAAPENPAATR